MRDPQVWSAVGSGLFALYLWRFAAVAGQPVTYDSEVLSTKSFQNMGALCRSP